MPDNHGMTVHDENGVYRSGIRERRIQRRKQFGVGLAGLAVFGAAGVFGVQAIQLAQSTTTREPKAMTPLVSPSPSPSPTVSAAKPPRQRARSLGPGKVTRSGARQEASPTPTPSPSVSAVSPSGGVAAADAVNRHDENTGRGVIRVTSAGFDLTGQPELSIVGDSGWLVGRARCTKTVRNEPGSRPRMEPSTLVCWRVSEDRSVVTVAVTQRGRPSSGESVAVLEREWARLG
ncbi:hypothetical protein JIG36_39455 [Actinoplanes sp. LDG1-06]|uniref:Serine/threonine protein kinase n=1 Tax=Paractinoplanes ovalisporus TaxID=2810368 RepID=A0ABS2AP05_9ACTN|nr:hypothetical protein [Actinoplanes ovalisporus]MBM2621598.1 hypothetical protein [Actinoplanes ovalisporus]